ncbi:MAG: hypothetical protein EKK56_08020 [Flavobacteriaceae bacterium]|uniref:hypothetical protein n=1 Tax=Flavobacterium sp. UBA6195 TaxID=1946554 RepID=UPI000FA3C921|nr:hypothetical protein [Flavobacterium sp. UBA6195]RTL11738.1 MAG: hypothetical protein EKK56_08020 [Flavobacteriaceae bacterium]
MALKKNKTLKVSIIFLMLISLFLGVKYYKVSIDFKDYMDSSELENKVLESQLTEILYKYDSVSIKNKADSIRFSQEIKLINSESFKNASKFKSVDDSIMFFTKEQQIGKSNIVGKSLNNNVDSNIRSLIKSDYLNALNVNAKGVKIYSESYNLREPKIQQLRVCFTLQENQFVKAGNKTIFVQVVNPKNQIISSENTYVETENNIKLQYSASVSTNYQRQDTDVCTYVDLEQKKTIRGKYKINIYHDFVKIGTTVFEY